METQQIIDNLDKLIETIQDQEIDGISLIETMENAAESLIESDQKLIERNVKFIELFNENQRLKKQLENK